jgi:hypothetical protein
MACNTFYEGGEESFLPFASALLMQRPLPRRFISGACCGFERGNGGAKE